jgi:hypothetical protein
VLLLGKKFYLEFGMKLFAKLDRSKTFEVEIHTSLSEVYGDSRFHELKTIVTKSTVESVENHLSVNYKRTTSRRQNAIFTFSVINKAEKGDKCETTSSSIGEFLEHFIAVVFGTNLNSKIKFIKFDFEGEEYLYQYHKGEFSQVVAELAS